MRRGALDSVAPSGTSGLRGVMGIASAGLQTVAFSFVFPRGGDGESMRRVAEVMSDDRRAMEAYVAVRVICRIPVR